MTTEQRDAVSVMNRKLAESIASEIRECSELRLHLLETLCDIAGLSYEWNVALFDCAGYEDVAYRAAKILGVSI